MKVADIGMEIFFLFHYKQGFRSPVSAVMKEMQTVADIGSNCAVCYIKLKSQFFALLLHIKYNFNTSLLQ